MRWEGDPSLLQVIAAAANNVDGKEGMCVSGQHEQRHRWAFRRQRIHRKNLSALLNRGGESENATRGAAAMSFFSASGRYRLAERWKKRQQTRSY